jgi:hypothetical protein
MKKICIVILFLSAGFCASSQSVYPITADIVLIKTPPAHSGNNAVLDIVGDLFVRSVPYGLTANSLLVFDTITKQVKRLTLNPIYWDSAYQQAVVSTEFTSGVFSLVKRNGSRLSTSLDGRYRPIGYVPSWAEITSKPTTKVGFGLSDVVGYIDTAAMFSGYVRTGNIPSSTVSVAGTTGISVTGSPGNTIELSLKKITPESVATTGNISTTGSVFGANLSVTTATVTGALSVTGSITALGGLTGTLTTSAQPNVTGLGTLLGLTISGAFTASNMNTSILTSTGSIKTTGTVYAKGLSVVGDIYNVGGILNALFAIVGTLTADKIIIVVAGPGTIAEDITVQSASNQKAIRVTDVSTGVVFAMDGLGNFTTTGSAIIGNNLTVTGTIAAANLSSSTYTPIITNVAGGTSITTTGVHYSRIGDDVTVSGWFAANTTGTTAFEMSLPFAPVSNFVDGYELNGQATKYLNSIGSSASGTFIGKPGDKTAYIQPVGTGVTLIWRFQLNYRIR